MGNSASQLQADSKPAATAYDDLNPAKREGATPECSPGPTLHGLTRVQDGGKVDQKLGRARFGGDSRPSPDTPTSPQALPSLGPRKSSVPRSGAERPVAKGWADTGPRGPRGAVRKALSLSPVRRSEPARDGEESALPSPCSTDKIRGRQALQWSASPLVPASPSRPERQQSSLVRGVSTLVRGVSSAASPRDSTAHRQENPVVSASPSRLSSLVRSVSSALLLIDSDEQDKDHVGHNVRYKNGSAVRLQSMLAKHRTNQCGGVHVTPPRADRLPSTLHPKP